MTEKIFVGNIPTDSKPSELLDILKSSFKLIEFTKLHPKKGSIKKGFMILELFHQKKEEDFLKKISKEKFFFKGQELYFSKYLSEKEVEERNNELREKKLFVSDLPEETTDEEFHKILSFFGPIETCYLSRDRYMKKKVRNEESSINSLFGFVTFKDKISAKKCLENYERVFDLPLKIVRFKPREKNKGKSRENMQNFGSSHHHFFKKEIDFHFYQNDKKNVQNTQKKNKYENMKVKKKIEMMRKREPLDFQGNRKRGLLFSPSKLLSSFRHNWENLRFNSNRKIPTRFYHF